MKDLEALVINDITNNQNPKIGVPTFGFQI